ncbi:hypothetical protein [Mongoliitalea daihaiensis]|uniref:hypothetical protein n=1 Tax=Mongoliitalea daihaiensis TaxID=2782006 RepID=UPI001F3420C3|nr:hypothetical protein [Mongoliitalea daihaiensis]UJP63438.1 hypothetical protein IPZ59_11315 [Mongoliitalea daihaiensis]
MKFFYVSSIPDFKGRFLIHTKECPYIPSMLDRDYLGPFNTGTEAQRKAAKIRTSTSCCSCCSKDRLMVFSAIRSDSFVESRE